MSRSVTWRKHIRSLFSWGWRFGPPTEPAVQIELPLSPAHTVALRHHVRSERQTIYCLLGAGTIFALLLSAVPFRGGYPPLWLMATIAALLAGTIAVVDWLVWQRGHTAEIRKGVYFRISGPIRVSLGRDTRSVYVGDRKITYISSTICHNLRDLGFGYIDYAPRSRIIFEQRDADGELIYRYPEYRPDDDPTITYRLPSLMKAVLWGAGGSTVFVLCILALAAWAQSRR